MKKTSRFNGWLKGALAIVLLGFALYLLGMRGVKAVRAQAAGVQTSASGFSWEYQLDFTAPTLPSARQQASSLAPGLNNQGVASQLQALGGSNFRLAMSGSQGLEQVRQVIYSPDMAGFIGGPAELEVDMPVGSLLDMTFKLESNLTTGYGWEIVPSESTGFVQTEEPTFTAESIGRGVPSLQTFVLHPNTVGDAKIKLVYRRPFGPVEAATRHLRINFSAQAIGIDLSNPHPKVISLPAESSKSPNAPNPIAGIPVKGTLPPSFDWRTAGIVPAIRNQGACGACWAFGTVGIMESAIAKAGGGLIDLSEQFLVSCNTSGFDCAGGLTAHMWHYDTLGKNQTAIGAVLETEDPYTANNGSCNVAYNHPYTLSGWQFIVPNEWTMPTVDEIKNAIYTYGPVTAGICVGNAFKAYHTDTIFSTDETGDCQDPNLAPFQTNHQVILVGWDDVGGYWILRNQWGTYWGVNGYMKIAYNTSRVGEGTSWVAWTGSQASRIYLPLINRVYAGPLPGVIVNGNFESGSTGWTEYSQQDYYPLSTSSDLPVTPHSGSYVAWLGGVDDEISYIQQQVTISSGAPYLVYWHWISSDDACGNDFGSVLINGIAVNAYLLCGSTDTGGWVTHSVNLSAYAGQSVTLQIRAATNSSGTSHLFVDDVSFQASASAANGIAPTTPDGTGILVPVKRHP